MGTPEAEIAQANAAALAKMGTRTRSALATPTGVEVGLAAAKLLSANTNRNGLHFFNNSVAPVYICFGQAANTTDRVTVAIKGTDNWTALGPIYTGEIWAIRLTGSGKVCITELQE